jgi:hypothetical protein
MLVGPANANRETAKRGHLTVNYVRAERVIRTWTYEQNLRFKKRHSDEREQ